MTGIHPATLDLETLRGQCEVRFQKRSGPGGQHRNKVESGVVFRHVPTGIRSEATERRSQHENLRVGLSRMRLNLALQIRSKELTKIPNDSWSNHVRGGQVRIGRNHEEASCLIATCLDALHHHDWNIRIAAAWLGCGSSQLVKVLKFDRRALEIVNRERKARNLKPLR